MLIPTFIVLFFVAAFSGFASALPTLDVRQNQCNTGSINCCNSVQESSSPMIPLLFGFLGIPLPSPGSGGSQVGFTCSPITGFGLGSGSTCVSQPVCCNGNSFSGLVVIGCSPINIIL